jgi:hypothetical protein
MTKGWCARYIGYLARAFPLKSNSVGNPSMNGPRKVWSCGTDLYAAFNLDFEGSWDLVYGLPGEPSRAGCANGVRAALVATAA